MLRWLAVLLVLSLISGLVALGVLPGLAVGLSRILFSVYVTVLAASLVVAVLRG
jgi:uncharacterized membrane protein YtjA (UPF0391 family)